MFINSLYQTVASFMTKLTLVVGKVAIGATGAVGAQTGRGFAVVRAGVGSYTVTVSGQGSLAIQSARASLISATHIAYVTAVSNSARTITIKTATFAAPTVAADPTSGDELQVNAEINNSSTGF